MGNKLTIDHDQIPQLVIDQVVGYYKKLSTNVDGTCVTYPTFTISGSFEKPVLYVDSYINVPMSDIQSQESVLPTLIEQINAHRQKKIQQCREKIEKEQKQQQYLEDLGELSVDLKEIKKKEILLLEEKIAKLKKDIEA